MSFIYLGILLFHLSHTPWAVSYITSAAAAHGYTPSSYEGGEDEEAVV